MSGIKFLAYDNILTYLHIETSVNMYNIDRNVRSAIFVETAKNLIDRWRVPSQQRSCFC